VQHDVHLEEGEDPVRVIYETVQDKIDQHIWQAAIHNRKITRIELRVRDAGCAALREHGQAGAEHAASVPRRADSLPAMSQRTNPPLDVDSLQSVRANTKIAHDDGKGWQFRIDLPENPVHTIASTDRFPTAREARLFMENPEHLAAWHKYVLNVSAERAAARQAEMDARRRAKRARAGEAVEAEQPAGRVAPGHEAAEAVVPAPDSPLRVTGDAFPDLKPGKITLVTPAPEADPALLAREKVVFYKKQVSTLREALTEAETRLKQWMTIDSTLNPTEVT
jgi:hypothetical protein